ncbi:uncharacterized protein BKCO1_3300089 [Diplodia corticola]|uniref:Mcm2 3 5 family protein n=1 Tax=Diplodia corticola TaxID=236234 RepID=A0A1J9QXN5_9PEZI|nr:uncharacterized protein BKCO1_3300089 [Diplodia corticola]OJD33152.1 hypothetical protein BKCO1_3300089 [Diplodia corticola]
MQSVSHGSLEEPFLQEENTKPPSKPPKMSRADWPTSPSTLKDSSPSTFMRLLPSILLLLIPLGFYALGVFILRLNGQPENPEYDVGDRVIQAIKVASTLWPILFAAVVGAMLKAAALYYAERGTMLGTLEILTTSQTLVSTFRGCFSHRIFGIWTAVLVVIWSLSPAGGQAVLRSVEPEVHKQHRDYPLSYYPSGSLFDNMAASPFVGASGSTWAKGKLHRAVDAAISSLDATVLFSKGTSPGFDAAVQRLGGEEQAAQSAQSDPWGNVRIPFLHLLPGYNEEDRGAWIDVSQTEIAPYSSLIGHTIRGVPQSSVGNISLSLQTVYQTLSASPQNPLMTQVSLLVNTSSQCSPWFNGSQWLQQNPGKLTMHKSTNTSIFTENPLAGDYANIFFDILQQANHSEPTPFSIPTNPVDKAILVFGTRGSTATNMYSQIRMTHCPVSATYVETEVLCTRSTRGGALPCSATRMRATPLHTAASNWSSLSLRASFTGNYLMYIPDTIQSAHPVTPTGLESYLQDPPTSFQDDGFDVADYDGVPLPVFEARLALVVNTFYHASLNASNFLGADGVARYVVEPWYYANQYGNASGTWEEYTAPRYEVKPAWFALYLAATTVLAVCAVATVVVAAVTRAPDVLGGVSGLTRDAAYVTGAPAGGSGVAAAERARALRGVWVRIQDVKPEEEVGRIAFSDQKDFAGAAGGLRWERRYE